MFTFICSYKRDKGCVCGVGWGGGGGWVGIGGAGWKRDSICPWRCNLKTGTYHNKWARGV